MKTTMLSLLMAGVAPAAQTDAAQTIARAGSRDALAGPETSFTGRVRIDPLYDANELIEASGAYVSFEAGARSAWHTHPRGQYLVVTSGVGRTQQWGGPVQEIRPGDVLWCPPGVKHWHGAAPDAAMTHLAITGMENGRNVQWMEQVSDEQYQGR